MPKLGSINLNNPVHGGGYNPGQAGAAQAPNLKALTLTIDDFRQFAAGKYNAGAAPGGRIGPHRAWARLESRDINPSEASAIRLAFAFALEDAGVQVIGDYSGKPHDEGDAVKVISYEDRADLKRDEYIETLLPTVRWTNEQGQTRLLQQAEVVVGRPTASNN